MKIIKEWLRSPPTKITIIFIYAIITDNIVVTIQSDLGGFVASMFSLILAYIFFYSWIKE